MAGAWLANGWRCVLLVTSVDSTVSGYMCAVSMAPYPLYPAVFLVALSSAPTAIGELARMYQMSYKQYFVPATLDDNFRWRSWWFLCLGYSPSKMLGGCSRSLELCRCSGGKWAFSTVKAMQAPTTILTTAALGCHSSGLASSFFGSGDSSAQRPR